MSDLRAWIRARREAGYGTTHLLRAVALCEAGVREGLAEITLILDEAGADLVSGMLPDKVRVEVWESSLTSAQEAAKLTEAIKELVPDRIDSRNPRPLVYLIGNDYDVAYQQQLWKGGAELVLVVDEPVDTYADWYVIGKPYGGELGVNSKTGYTRYLRGGHYGPLRIAAMKGIHKQYDHRTQARRFAIATENLDAEAWLPRLADALTSLKPTKYVEGDWTASLLLLPGPDCPADDELRGLLGDTGDLSVEISPNRLDHSEPLAKVDLLFSADNVVLTEALALGTVRIALPRKGVERDKDLMLDHLVRREAALTLPDPSDESFGDEADKTLTRATFDAAWRRGQNRIGQYLCDGMGSIRIMRQTAFKIYTVPQNLIRFFEMGDPEIPNL